MWVLLLWTEYFHDYVAGVHGTGMHVKTRSLKTVIWEKPRLLTIRQVEIEYQMTLFMVIGIYTNV